MAVLTSVGRALIRPVFWFTGPAGNILSVIDEAGTM
jgi:hypothetical protein